MKKVNEMITLLLLGMLVLSCDSKVSTESDALLDVLHQDIDLKVDWERKRLIGTTRLSFIPKAHTDEVILKAVGMEVHSVTDAQGRDLHYLLNDTLGTMGIHLGKKYGPKDEFTVVIAYETRHENQSDPANIWGSFGNGVRFFGPTQTENERRKQLWAFGEPHSTPYWFPTNDDPTDTRTTRISVRVEEPLQVLANGDLVASKKNDMFTTFQWYSETPYPPHHTFLVIGEYGLVEQRFGEIPIYNYGYPDETVGTRESVVRLPDMMEFFSAYTGVSYPYDTYSQIFIQDFGGWKPALATSLITENMIDDKTTHEDFLYGWDLTEGEALAAQWFGSYLRPKDWNEAWLTKGFARYFSGLYNQHMNGHEEFLTYQHAPDLSAYLTDWQSGLDTRVVPDTLSNVNRFVNGNAPYAKGARVLHMLRMELGETEWNAVVKNYLSRYGDKSVGTADLIGVVNGIHQEPMDWFFDQWVYGAGHPIFEVHHHYDEPKKQLELTVFQKQQVDSLVFGRQIPFFQGKMEIEIDGAIEEVRLLPQAKSTYRFPWKRNPRLVNFDFEDTWIKEVKHDKTIEALLTELEESKDALHRVSLMREMTAVYLNEPLDEKKRGQIKSALENRVLNEGYWRMRLIAMNQLSQLFSPDPKGKIVLDDSTEAVLLELVAREKSWVKAWALNFLGNTHRVKYVPLYLEGLGDYSDRVVFMSAIALGKSKDGRAYDALMELPKKPSWKNQSLISALYGLKELKDVRAYELAMNSLTASEKPHWNLGTPIWDHRLAAAYTLKALALTEEGSELVFRNFEDALTQKNRNDIFYNAQTLGVLGGSHWHKAIHRLRAEFESDLQTMEVIEGLQDQFPVREH